MFVTMLGGASSIMLAGASGDIAGYTSGGYGSLRAEPDPTLTTEQLTYRVLTGDITYKVAGDQTTYLASKTLTIGPNSFAFSGGSLAFSAGSTTATFTPGFAAIVEGKAYQIGIA